MAWAETEARDSQASAASFEVAEGELLPPIKGHYEYHPELAAFTVKRLTVEGIPLYQPIEALRRPFDKGNESEKNAGQHSTAFTNTLRYNSTAQKCAVPFFYTEEGAEQIWKSARALRPGGLPST